MTNYQLGCVCHFKHELMDGWCDGRCKHDAHSRREVAEYVGFPMRRAVGRRIRDARKSLSMTQSELGERLARQRSYAAVSDLERGKTGIDLDDLADIAAVLNRDLSWFIPVLNTDKNPKPQIEQE